MKFVFAGRTALVAYVLALAATGGACTGREAPDRAAAAKCPFEQRYSVYLLPERMSRAQVKACQAYFARRAPDGRFAPGSASFLSQFCSERERHSACQDTRVALCRLAVSGGEFRNVPSCLAATPGVRQVVHKKSPRVSLIVSEPWVLFRSPYTSPLVDVDNEINNWFPEGSMEFSEPTRTAWDSRSGRIVPFPSDLVDFIGRSPYVQVLGLRTVRLGGIRTKQIDVIVRKGDPNARTESLCGEYLLRDQPCLPISADRNEEGFVSLALMPGEPYRVIDLRTRSGRLIIHVSGLERFDELVGAERILRTLRVG